MRLERLHGTRCASKRHCTLQVYTSRAGRIEAVGAQGGCIVGCGMAGRWGSPGAKIVGNFIFNISEQIVIAPGHGGGNGHGTPNWNEAGGGGGSYVFEYGSTSDILNSDNNDDPIIIAGGGGSAPRPLHTTSATEIVAAPTVASAKRAETPLWATSAARAPWPGEVFGGDGGRTNSGSYVGGAGGGWTSNGARTGGPYCGSSGSRPSCMGGGSVKTDKKLVGGQGRHLLLNISFPYCKAVKYIFTTYKAFPNPMVHLHGCINSHTYS